MNKMLLDNAFIRGECERSGVAPAALDTFICETYAQRNEDLIVESLLIPALRRLGRPLNSIFYFEIGANHPFQTSNTYLFYRKYDARGVLVEANHLLAQQLKAARPRDQVIEAAISARHDSTITFHQCAISELSGLNEAHIKSFRKNAPIEQVTVTNIHINALLERFADRQIDYLSIDVEGVDIELLDAMNFSKFRPYFIQCEPSEHFLPGASDKVATMLEATGYFLIARTEINLIFVDRALLHSSSIRRNIRSFDVFDTLIARNCIDPHRIFDRVEQLTQNAGFAGDRLSAEQSISNRTYNLDDIYDELTKIRGWSQAQRDAAQAAEIAAEMDAVIPIAENLADVRDGDVAVSDMYLPERVIRSLLKKAGLSKEMSIVVSSHGKRSGEIWPLLLANFQIEQHLGDNHVSDIQSPERFGIASRHTSVSSPDYVESWFIKHGLRDLAQIIRQGRLVSWHEDPTIRQLQLIQLRFNFPILLVSSILLSRFVVAGNIQNVLFCSRDCNLWLEIFRVVRSQMGVQVNEFYFYTSRQARIKSTQSYRRYTAELLQNNGVLVDICGTGWSLSHMMDKLGSYSPLYFIHHLSRREDYEKIRPTPVGVSVHSVVGGGAAGMANNFLEMSNYADHPQVEDVCYIRNAPHPIFAPERRSASTLSMVREQRSSFRQMVALCESEGLVETLTAPDDALRAIVVELYKSLCDQKLLPSLYESMHMEEETDQMRLLRTLV
jgi:FkbM family methyltransferase